jgi:hypothetical protein
LPVDTNGVDMAPRSASPAQPAAKASSVHAKSAQLDRVRVQRPSQNIDLGFRKQHTPVVGNTGECVQIAPIYKRQTARISRSSGSLCTQIVSKSGRATGYTRHFPICISSMTQCLQAARPAIALHASCDQLSCALSCRASTGFDGPVGGMQGTAPVTDMLAERTAPAPLRTTQRGHKSARQSAKSYRISPLWAAGTERAGM